MEEKDGSVVILISLVEDCEGLVFSVVFQEEVYFLVILVEEISDIIMIFISIIEGCEVVMMGVVLLDEDQFIVVRMEDLSDVVVIFTSIVECVLIVIGLDRYEENRLIVDNLEGKYDLSVVKVSKYEVFMFSLIVENNCQYFGSFTGGREVGFVMVVSFKEGRDSILISVFFVEGGQLGVVCI